MIDNAEFGYTPTNLKQLRKRHDLTLQQVADIVGVKSWRMVARWELELGRNNRSDMPYTKWAMLIKKILKNLENPS